MNILWISRHQMTDDQLNDLKRIIGEPFELTQWKDTAESLDVLIPALDNADAIAAVLPIKLLAQVVNYVGSKPVYISESGRRPTGMITTLPDGRTEQEFAFVHIGWSRIESIELSVKECR